jgi:hypothetical protein
MGVHHLKNKKTFMDVNYDFEIGAADILIQWRIVQDVKKNRCASEDYC